MHKTGAIIPDREADICYLDSACWSYIHTSYDRAVQEGQVLTLQGQPEQRMSPRHNIMAPLPTNMEWSIYVL